MVALSVVVPCFNEEDVLELLVVELRARLADITEDYEVVMVDDGSRDRTLELMRGFHAADGRFRYLALSRNFGKESAMLAGLTHARGDSVAIIDADLQHPPELLVEMVARLDEGHDQVVARRTRSGDAVVRTALARGFYKIVNRMVEVRLENGVGDFRLLSRRAVDALLALGEYNRFSKGLFTWIGFDTAVVDYDNIARSGGASKWRVRDLFNYGIDGLLSFNSKPLRLAIWLGGIVAFIAFVYSLWVLGDAILNGNSVPGYVTTICLVVGFGGVQMIMLGVIGEYLGRIYAETKQRPHFLIRDSSEVTSVTQSLGPARDPASGR